MALPVNVYSLNLILASGLSIVTGEVDEVTKMFSKVALNSVPAVAERSLEPTEIALATLSAFTLVKVTSETLINSSALGSTSIQVPSD